MSRVLLTFGLLVLATAQARSDTFRADWSESDVTDELQQAINDAPQAGRTIVLVPREKPYAISNTIVVRRSHISIVGLTSDDGDPKTIDEPATRVRVSSQWNGTTHLLFAFLGGTENSIEDLKINGNVDKLQPTSAQFGVLLAGTKRCLVHNLKFQNIGRSKLHPGGSCVTLTAVESGASHPIPRLGRGIFVPEPFSGGSDGQTYDLRMPGKHCQGNTVQHCVFDDLNGNFEMRSSFGVRIASPWRADKGFNQFTVFARNNDVVNNWFEGYFDSALEVGGPASRDNYVAYNLFQNSFKTAMEADRGASYNDFEFNIVRNHWTMKHVNGLQPGKDAEARCFPIRDQGFAEEGVPTRFAKGNRYRWNHVDSINGVSSTKTGLVLLNRSLEVVLRGNTVGAIGTDKNLRTSLYGVVMDNEVRDATFSRGTNELPRRDRYRKRLKKILLLPGVVTDNNDGKSGFVFK